MHALRGEAELELFHERFALPPEAQIPACPDAEAEASAGTPPRDGA